MLAKLKELGLGLKERQALANGVAKVAKRASPRSTTVLKAAPLLDVSLAKDCSANLNVHTPVVKAEIDTLPRLGDSPLLPGESAAAGTRRPDARVRLICLYGAAEEAKAFDEWRREAPAWLELRAVELPGHGSREAEGVWSIGRQRERSRGAAPAAGADPALALADECHEERAQLVRALTEEIAPLLDGPRVAIYGFSSGAILAYLVLIELEARRAPRLPFRFFVCGRGAPHCIHWDGADADRLRYADDKEVLDRFHNMLGVPLEKEAAAFARQAALWRAAILPSSLHVGEPRLPAAPPPPFPIRPDRLEAVEHATGAPKVSACPIVVLWSNMDKVWVPPLPMRWADVAACGFRDVEVAGVAHFRLMCDKAVRAAVSVEIAAALCGHVRFGVPA
jgi:surfactin synthase thioesterase subunit